MFSILDLLKPRSKDDSGDDRRRSVKYDRNGVPNTPRARNWAPEQCGRITNCHSMKRSKKKYGYIEYALIEQVSELGGNAGTTGRFAGCTARSGTSGLSEMG